MVRRVAGLVAAAGMVVTVACGQTDAGITSSVKSRLASDDTVKAYQVNVDTRNHVVTLSGDVETAVEKDRALMIARETDGVRDVIDQLRVNEAAATSGISGDIEDDPDVRLEIDNDLQRDTGRPAVEIENRTRGSASEQNTAEKVGDATVQGAKKAGQATVSGAKKAGEATATGAKKVGGAIRDAVTDDDRDSDKDGK